MSSQLSRSSHGRPRTGDEWSYYNLGIRGQDEIRFKSTRAEGNWYLDISEGNKGILSSVPACHIEETVSHNADTGVFVCHNGIRDSFAKGHM